MLPIAAVLLAAAVLFVVLFKRLGLGAVLGYLAAGVLVGPAGLGLIGDVETILHISEFGVVLLLFVIGLELQPSRLWTLRGAVFGLGGTQVLACGTLLGLAAAASGLAWTAAIVVGLSLALSSTAFVMQLLAERNELGQPHGQRAFAVLLFQDLAVIPILALLPLLGTTPDDTDALSPLASIALTVAAVVAVVLGGRYLLRPILRLLAATGVAEIFTAAALLLVLATALLLDAVGLSMSLGAFLAGVLLADSEFRHELQADIEPFKGLLLGLFFMAVGMSADLSLAIREPLAVVGFALGLVAIKLAVIYALARAARLPPSGALALAASLSQGGEFAFVLFAAAVSAGVLPGNVQPLLILVVTVSMVTTPLLIGLLSRYTRPAADAPAFDEIDTAPTPVVIAGFGPTGQIVGRILRMRKTPYTVLENDWQHVAFLRRFGNPVFFSDATRIEVLRAAHADQAKLLVIAIMDAETSLRLAEMAHRHFPAVRTMAFARDRRHALRLMEAGVGVVIRRSLLSSLEMSRAVLEALGVPPGEAQRSVELFQSHDEDTLRRQLAILRDEEKVIQTAQQSAVELEQLFEADERRENAA